MAIEPFTIAVDDAVLSDLRERIARTRWPDEIDNADWRYGTNLAYLRDLLTSWTSTFDWRAREKALNQLSHFRAEVDGAGIHFVHERGNGPDPLPLVLTHGWPSTFTEHLKLLPLLTDPGAHGGDPEDAFDVVITSLPGYGFSDRPNAPGRPNAPDTPDTPNTPDASGTTAASIADLWCRLMSDGLGYGRFGAHGSDIGARVTTELGRRHPEHLVGIHLSGLTFDRPPQPWSPAEHEYLSVNDRWWRAEGAYSEIQSTKPQTLAYGLADSPAGLAAWIVEKFRAWSDSGGEVESRFSREHLLTNLTIYWVTETINSSIREYYESRRAPRPTGRIEVPAGFAVFANEFMTEGTPPAELADRTYQVTRWTELDRGGHFPALEEPELLAEELRAFFRPLRTARQAR